MRLLLTWLINAAALMALPYLMHSVSVSNVGTALIAALVGFAALPAWAAEKDIVDTAVDALVDALAGGFRRFSTEHMMKLAVPGGALKIGNDLPPPAGYEQTIFPPHLRSIENPELRAVLKELDRSPDSLQGTGAKDWSKLDQRMNYIIDLFRTDFEKLQPTSKGWFPARITW